MPDLNCQENQYQGYKGDNEATKEYFITLSCANYYGVLARWINSGTIATPTKKTKVREVGKGIVSRFPRFRQHHPSPGDDATHRTEPPSSSLPPQALHDIGSIQIPVKNNQKRSRCQLGTTQTI